MNLDLAAMKESCNNLSKNRAALFGYEQVLGASVVVKMAGSAAKNIAHGIGGLLSKGKYYSIYEEWYIPVINAIPLFATSFYYGNSCLITFYLRRCVSLIEF